MEKRAVQRMHGMHPILGDVQTMCRKCAAPFSQKEMTQNLTILRHFSGAPPGTRTLGPLIKSATPASNVHFVNRELSSIFDGASFLYWSFALHRSANFAPRVNHCTG